ncbi:RNA polymerase I-specific transcription-initiation factor-domain-containing protein [Podospora fimiseda]|uniref:RNA polymerase I-specific transcription-initiation factor-domain-containing protein n=1 Tax=Podospora fimiseda TaxID=252190 RepID=A0AAN7BRX0_9PEZI|nr:RNA polymerase I-specific transcription-initiation factor-domain-containing protein [Podospora fimiseda]
MDEKLTVGHLASVPWNLRPRTDVIFGRFNYIPAAATAADDDDGHCEIRRNRVKDETPHFKQVMPFDTWCSPVRINTSHLSQGKPWRIARHQENWLSIFLPEASLDDEDLEALLLDEIASAQGNSKPSAPDSAFLFDTGDITDMRDSWHGIIKKHTVLAVASGVSGNILRLISLTHEEWSWDAAGVRVMTHIPNYRLEGEWSEDCMAITLIRFANDPKKSDPVRWLLVQRGTATTVYEPEVRTIPMPSRGAPGKHSCGPTPSQIYANPLITIPMSKTAGSLHSDVCFSRSEDKGLPQLAIIDQCGYWSIWEITGNLRARNKRLTPVLKLCGNSLTGSIPKLPSNPANDSKPHQMICLSLWTNPSQGSSQKKGSSQVASPEPGSTVRRLLLLNNGKVLNLFDLATQTLHPVTHKVLVDESQQILDIMPSSLNSSHAFILTNTNILWVVAKESRAKSKSKSATSMVFTLQVLISCQHRKGITDPTLRLDVSEGTFINNIAACFVCVWSAKDSVLTVFWFLTPESEPVRYQRELVNIKTPTNFVGLSMMPVARRIGGDEPTSTVGKAVRNAQLRFFQFLSLGQDLDVHSALCVWSDQAAVEVPAPDTKVWVEDSLEAEQVHFESRMEGVFAVPDWFDEKVASRKVEGEDEVMKERQTGPARIKNAMVLAERSFCAQEIPQVDENMVSFDFIPEIVERKSGDGYMPNHSLMELINAVQPENKILDLARQYANEQPEPQPYSEHWFYTPESTRPVPGFNPDDMARNIRNFMPRPKRSISAYKQHRKTVGQQIAAQMFLSNIGITSIPRDWIEAPEQNSSQSQFSSSQQFSSTPQSPTKLLSSQLLPWSSQLNSSQPESPGKSSSQPTQPISTAVHLRQYITTSSTSKNDPQLDLTPWELGTNPDDSTWRRPGQDLEAEEIINRRNRKIVARRKRRERLSQAIFGEESSFVDTSEPAAILPSSQFVFSQQVPGSPTFLRSPVRRVREGSPLRREYLRGDGESQSQSQSQSQGVIGIGTPSQKLLFGVKKKRDSLGWVTKKRDSVGGSGGRDSFGGRLSPFKKKRPSGVRLSGFR